MNDQQYYVRGCTALLDAVGGAIHHIGNVHKYAREEDRPEKTLFIITTDGMENSSRRYDYDRVKNMVERQKERFGWEFIFLGANIDAVEVAGRFGIKANRAVNYECDSEGTKLNYDVLNEIINELTDFPDYDVNDIMYYLNLEMEDAEYDIYCVAENYPTSIAVVHKLKCNPYNGFVLIWNNFLLFLFCQFLFWLYHLLQSFSIELLSHELLLKLENDFQGKKVLNKILKSY